MKLIFLKVNLLLINKNKINTILENEEIEENIEKIKDNISENKDEIDFLKSHVILKN